MAMVDSGLAEALQDGIFETPLWSTFLDRLRATTRARYVTLICRNAGDSGRVALSSGGLPEPSPEVQFHRKYVEAPAPYREMREGRVYALEELIDPKNPWRTSPSVDPRAAAPPASHMRIVRVTEPGGARAWLGCWGGREIGSSVSAQLAALVPHLRAALRLVVTLQRERLRSAVTAEALRKLGVGWMTLDAQGRIVDIAPALARTLDHSPVLGRGRNDRLTPANPGVDRELTAAIQRFADDPAAPSIAIRLSRTPMLDMLVAPLLDGGGLAGGRAVAVAYVRGDVERRDDRCDQLAALFGLLPSEARLALAIAQGMTIAEAAADLGITVETARHYSKKIYAKTGTRGQTELVRNILASVLALA